MEAGHAAQNLLLQAGALDLDAALVGAFDDVEVHAAAALPMAIIGIDLGAKKDAAAAKERTGKLGAHVVDADYREAR